jgi:hypothetical protein
MLAALHPPRAGAVTSSVAALHLANVAYACQQPAIEPAALLLAQCRSAPSQHIRKLVQLTAARQTAQH